MLSALAFLAYTGPPPPTEWEAQPDVEFWKVVPSQPDIEASSWGRVRLRRPPFTGGHTPKATFGIWSTDARGQRFIFSRRKRPRTLRVAPLVCEAFHGRKPFKDAVCMHDDEDSRNNRPGNLRWGTQLENMNYPNLKKSNGERSKKRG